MSDGVARPGRRRSDKRNEQASLVADATLSASLSQSAAPATPAHAARTMTGLEKEHDIVFAWRNSIARNARRYQSPTSASQARESSRCRTRATRRTPRRAHRRRSRLAACRRPPRKRSTRKQSACLARVELSGRRAHRTANYHFRFISCPVPAPSIEEPFRRGAAESLCNVVPIRQWLGFSR